ncbi:MAG: flippase [Rhodothermales bacterium]
MRNSKWLQYLGSPAFIDTGILGAANFVVKPLGFVFITYVCIASIGIEGYGVMTNALAIAAIAVGVSTAGTSFYTVREIARDKTAVQRFLSSILPVRLGLSIVAVAGSVTLTWLTMRVDTLVAVAAGAYAIGLGLIEYERSFFRAFENLRFESVSIVSEKLVVILAGTAGLLVSPTALGVLAGMSAGAAVVALANLKWIHSLYGVGRLPRQIDRAFAKKTLKTAYPLGLASIFVLLYFRVDSVMLKYMTSDVVVGQYGLAYRVLESLITIPAVAVALLLPRLSFIFGSKRPESGFALIRTSLHWTITISAVISCVVFLFSDPIANVLAGGPQPVSAKALSILIWAFPFGAAAFVLSNALISMDEQKLLATALGVAAAANILLNALLIPRYSLYGASFATVATELTGTLLMLLVVWKRNRQTV